MAKLSGNYEAMVLYHPDLEKEDVTAQAERFKGLIEQHEGTVHEINEWGKRHLAYAIEKVRDGYYVLFTFTCEPSLPAELERNLRINDKVLRYIVINQDEK